MAHVLACDRRPVAAILDRLPGYWLEALEQNQQIASCCRHPEDHEIVAFKSTEREPAPDIYVFHCTCGRKHRRFMVGSGTRPRW